VTEMMDIAHLLRAETNCSSEVESFGLFRCNGEREILFYLTCKEQIVFITGHFF